MTGPKKKIIMEITLEENTEPRKPVSSYQNQYTEYAQSDYWKEGSDFANAIREAKRVESERATGEG